jgi:hypothetical protein
MYPIFFGVQSVYKLFEGPVAKFRLRRLAGQYDNPYAIVDYIHQSETKNLGSVL